MIAGLPMYDWAELQPAHDELWATLRTAFAGHGIDAPAQLTRDIKLWDLWQSPELLLGQTCGMPYRQRLHGKVHLVAALDYGLPNVPDGHYNSVLITRSGDATDVADYAKRIFAFNGQDSQSGWAAAQNHVAALGFRFTTTLHTGAHRDSAIAVAEGRADIACIDAITWRLIKTFRSDITAALQVIATTEPTPGLPLITAFSQNPETVRASFSEALNTLNVQVKSQLGLSGKLAVIKAEAYLAVPTPPPPTQDFPAT